MNTPRRLGLRWPAEWEPHAATWIAWPHNPDTWPGRLAEAERAFVEMVRALHAHERVNVLVRDAASEEAVRRQLREAGVEVERAVGFARVPTDDAWIRDTGPVFLLGADGERTAVQFGFDAWGGKYPPWDRDAAVPRAIAGRLGVRRLEAGFVLEGGSVDGDGRGTLLTTESCLLHPNRGSGRTRESMEERLREWLGAECVVWLAGGIAGDDTDGHVDDAARFVDAGTVVAAFEEDASDENHAPLAENWRRLRASRDRDGKPLSVARLPMPPPLRADGARRPASYANFYLANGVALVPVFGAPSDAAALAVLRDVLTGREVVGIRCEHLVYGLGSIHCLTQQEPAPRPETRPRDFAIARE